MVAVGKIHTVRDALIAAAALVAALAGVGLAIWKTSEVLVPPLTTTAVFRDSAMATFRSVIVTSPEDFFGTAASNVNDLLKHRSIAVNLVKQIAAEQDPQ